MGHVRGGALRITHCGSDCGNDHPLSCDELKSTSLNPSLSTVILEAVGSRPETGMWRSTCFPHGHHFAPLVCSVRLRSSPWLQGSDCRAHQHITIREGYLLEAAVVHSCLSLFLLEIQNSAIETFLLFFVLWDFILLKQTSLFAPLHFKWKRIKFWITPLHLSTNTPVGLTFTLAMFFYSSR